MRLIDTDALKKAISNNPLIDFTDDDIFKIIDNAPAVEERPQGEWLFHRCSKCGTGFNKDINLDKYNFCPNCGADMRGTYNG